jgi:hypothetical protein
VWAGSFGACDTAKTARGVPTLRDAEAVAKTLGGDVDQQLLSKSVAGECLPDDSLHGCPLHGASPAGREGDK